VHDDYPMVNQNIVLLVIRNIRNCLKSCKICNESLLYSLFWNSTFFFNLLYNLANFYIKFHQSTLSQMILQKISDNELYAYLQYILNPSSQSMPTSQLRRRRVLYISNSYKAFLLKKNELEIPMHDPAEAQCSSIRPGDNFIGYGSNDQLEDIEALNVVRIRSCQWRARVQE
jgi:hypothetical protein